MVASPRALTRAIGSLSAAAWLLAPASASAYDISCHIALCQDIVTSLSQQEAVLATPPAAPEVCVEPESLEVPDAVRSAILAHPDHFLGGCVGPDTHVIPLLTDVTHAEAFDPLGLAKLVIANATTADEVAYAYGWLAHIATDVGVHGFASWHAEGTFAQWDPSSWSTWGYFVRHIRSERHVASHWIRPATPFQLEVAAGLIRRVFLRWDGDGLQHLVRHGLGHPPAPGADPASVILELTSAPLPDGVGLMARATVVVLAVFAATDAYTVRFERAAQEGQLDSLRRVAAVERDAWFPRTRPEYWRASVAASLYERARLAVRSVRIHLAEEEEAFIENNRQFSQDVIEDGIISALSDYGVYFKELPGVLAGRFEAIVLEALVPQWASDWVSALGDAASDVASYLGITDLVDYVRGQYQAHMSVLRNVVWPWLREQALADLKQTSAYQFYVAAVDQLETALSSELDVAFPVRFDLIDRDFEQAGVTKDAPYTASLGCLRGYHFYHNARVLTWAALVSPRNLDGLVSADLECEHRNTRFFRRYDRGNYTTFMRNVGPDDSAARPYCFAASDDYTTRFADLFVEDRDWPFVDRCVAGENARDRLNPATCAVNEGAPGKCANGSVVFFSDTGTPESCVLDETATTDVWRVSPGEAPARVWRSPPVSCPSWPCVTIAPYDRAASPDGSALAFVDNYSNPLAIRVVSLVGGADLSHASPGVSFAWDLQWAPDSHAVAFLDVFSGPIGTIVILDAAAGTTTTVERGYHPRWAHDSRSLLFFRPDTATSSTGRMMRHTLGPCGETSPVQGGAASVAREVPTAVAGDGRIFYYVTPYSAQSPYPASQASQKYGVRSADGSAAVSFVLPFAADAASWTPNGRYVALAGPADGGPAWSNVYLVDVGQGLPAAGATPTYQSFGRGQTPAISPDGRYLAFQRFDPTAADACGGAVSSPGTNQGVAVVDLSLDPPAEVLVTGVGPCSPFANCLCGSSDFAWSTTPGAWALFATFYGGEKPWRQGPVPLFGGGAPADDDLFEFTIPGGTGWEPLTDTQLPFSAAWLYMTTDPETGGFMMQCNATGRATNEDGVTGVRR